MIHAPQTYLCRTNAFPYNIREWNKLDLQLRNAKSFKKFRNTLLKLGRPNPDLIYRIHLPFGLKLLPRSRLDLNHLKEHRFKT